LYSFLWTAFFGVVSPPGAPGAVARAAPADGDVPPEMQARAEAVFSRIADALAPEFDIRGGYTIQVVREKVPNAWINQKNEIYVSTGLMELLVTDDQLAGVIGHEIAHGTLGHIPHRISQSLWTAFAVLALGTVAGASGASDWGGLLHMRDLFMFAYSRDQEAEADRVGMGYARAAGYEAEGLIEALQLMDRERRKLPSDSPWQELYRTHPPIPQRVSDLRFALTSERLLQRPLRTVTLRTRPAPSSAEEAAVVFARALLSGDVDEAQAMLLPAAAAGAAPGPAAGGAPAGGPGEGLRAWMDRHNLLLDAGWADAAAEVAPPDRGDESAFLGFDVTVSVRLVRFASRTNDLAADPSAGTGQPAADDAGDAVLVSPALSVTVRRSALGWFVVAWDVAED